MVSLYSALSELPVTVLGMTLANDRQDWTPPKTASVRLSAASPRKPSWLYAAALTFELSGEPGGLSTRLGAVPLHVRRYRSRLPPCWSHRIMKSPALRLAHGLQVSMSCWSVLVV